MRRRPLAPSIAPWTAAAGPVGGVSSYGDLARRRHRAWIFCDRCVPPWSIDNVDFAAWPWRRYLNYPSDARFRCPGCNQPMSMHVHNQRMAGTGPHLDYDEEDREC